jgi:hypothetical protein
MSDLDGPGEQPAARVIEADDEQFQLPDGRTSWIISLLILAVSGAAVFGLLELQVPKIQTAGFVLVASFTAPFVSAVRGHISMDRVVPFAGVLGVLAIVYFNICLSLGNYGYGSFFPSRGDPKGPLLYLMAFGGVPTASVIGGVLGCYIDRKRRGGEDDDHLMM